MKLMPSWLTLPRSRPREWLVGGLGYLLGVGLGYLLVVGALTAFPAFLRTHENLLVACVFLSPIPIAGWIGRRSYEQPNPLPVLLKDARRLALVGLAVATVFLAWMFLPGLFEHLAPTDLPGLAKLTLIGFGVIAWMLFRVERATNRASTANGTAVGRVESDVELIRDTLEKLLSRVSDYNATAGSIEGEVRGIRQEMTDIVSAITDIRGELEDARTEANVARRLHKPPASGV